MRVCYNYRQKGNDGGMIIIYFDDFWNNFLLTLQKLNYF
ncbi:hypothetical protein M23134_04305 [Microscilla marina ATCC 23134]|uniref:Uncharacterized protein n=1 Tax=Microscilla marina ATCC 23134 TaxID=313606 RepID=A1ZEG4_MICM2|nr:hypothetical protein M23134_04305 [Microscilla marina ATCC 23134]